jgi:integrase
MLAFLATIPANKLRGSRRVGLYKRNNSRFWWMNYVAEGIKRNESTGTTNKRLANRILQKKLADISEGRFRLVSSHPPTLSEWGGQFLEGILNPNTHRVYTSCLNTLNEYFGSISLDEISPVGIEEFKLKRIKAGAGPAIINRNLALLRRMSKLAARRRLIARSPFDEVEFLDERSVRRMPKILSYEEQRRLEAVAAPLLRTLIIVLTDTGLRVRKEALALRWEDVDLSAGVLYVRQSKTPAGRRSVPLTDLCSVTLRDWMRATGPEFSPYVFANPNCPSTHLKGVRKSWGRALKAAKLDWRPIYHLRATFASRLSAEGESDNLVAGMIGHSSPSIVSTYAKVADESKKRAIQKLNDARRSHDQSLQQPNTKALTEYFGKQKWIN